MPYSSESAFLHRRDEALSPEPEAIAALEPRDAPQEASGALSLIEAMQAGVAIVASNIDGIPEDVSDGDSALLVEPDNVEQLSQALARALTDPEMRGRLRRRARETFVKKFSAETFTSALRSLYAELSFEAGNG